MALIKPSRLTVVIKIRSSLNFEPYRSPVDYTGTLSAIPITGKVVDPCCSAIHSESVMFPTEGDVTIISANKVCLTSDSGAACGVSSFCRTKSYDCRGSPWDTS